MALYAVDRAKLFYTLDASIDTSKEGMLSYNFINGIIPSRYFTRISKLYCINIDSNFGIVESLVSLQKTHITPLWVTPENLMGVKLRRNVIERFGTSS